MDTNAIELTDNQQGAPVKDRTGASMSSVWDDNYRSGPIFGTSRNPSLTARNLWDALSAANGHGRRKTIVDVGAGTGRDTIWFALRGNILSTGVDVSAVGQKHFFEEWGAVEREVSPQGVAQFFLGDMNAYFERFRTPVTAISTHRTLHLLQEEDLKTFARHAADMLVPDGFLSIGARSVKDFKPKEMQWTERGVEAEYKPEMKRPGHVIRFMDKKQLTGLLGNDFDIRRSSFWQVMRLKE